MLFLRSPLEIVPVSPAPSELVSGFPPLLWILFPFRLRGFLAVVFNIASNLLSWYIPLSSIAVFKFPLSAAVICYADCTTASSGVTVGFVMYLCSN